VYFGVGCLKSPFSSKNAPKLKPKNVDFTVFFGFAFINYLAEIHLFGQPLIN